MPLTRLSLCVGVVAALGGCAPEIQNDWFTCDLSMGQGCPDGFVCDDGRCVTEPGGGVDAGTGTDATAPECGAGMGCSGGRECCNGRCVSTDSDPANCGGCDTACMMVCVMGTCDPTCSDDGDCDDGLSCTREHCSESRCVPDGLAPGTCQIEGECFTAGEPSPDNPCLVCGTNASEWSPAPAGTTCGAAGDCRPSVCREGLCQTEPADCGVDTCDGAPCVHPMIPCAVATCQLGTCTLSEGGYCLDDTMARLPLGETPGGTCSVDGRCLPCGGSGDLCCATYTGLGRALCATADPTTCLGGTTCL